MVLVILFRLLIIVFLIFRLSTKSKASNIKTVFVMVARFDQPKDQMLLVNAFSKLDNQNWLLELIGDGTIDGISTFAGDSIRIGR